MPEASTEEHKYQFKTEDERVAAINALPDDPAPGVDIDAWHDEQKLAMEQIQTVALLGDGTPAATTDDLGNPITPPVVTPPVETPPVEDANARRIQALQSDIEKMKYDSDNRLASQKAEHDKALETFKADLVANPPAPPVDTSITDNRIKSIREEVIGIQDKMDKDEEQMFDKEEYFKGMAKIAKLQAEAGILQDKKYTDLQDNVSEFQRKADEVEAARTLEFENNRKLEVQQKQREGFFRSMEEFRGVHEELKSTRSYHDLEQDYVKFGREVAGTYYGKTTDAVTEQEVELAMNKYNSKIPAIMESVQARGLQSPEGITQYMLLSNIAMAMDGYELNTSTGQWQEIHNLSGNKAVMPSLDDAYNYIKRKTGITGREMLEQNSQAVSDFSNAINQRANVNELSAEFQKQDIEDMSADDAWKIVQATDDTDIVMRKRMNPTDPVVLHYEKAAAVLKFAPVPV